MAKCERCGRKGLFFKTNEKGICRKCETAELEAEIKQLKLKKEKEAADLENEIDEIKKRREDEHQLLNEAILRAQKEAEKQTEPIYMNICKLQEKEQALQEMISEQEKKRISLENRIEKLNQMIKSAKYALSDFPDAARQERLEKIINDIDALVPPIESLNCLTMKDLRAKYKKNERLIKELCESNQKRYTTKANATLYKLMVLAMDAELQTVMKSLAYGKLDDAIAKVQKLTAKYYLIISEGNQSIAPTLSTFTGQIEYLYIEAVKLEYEYYIRRERAKEEQRALREQMRQELAERKLLEQQRKKVENEEQKYILEIERLKAQLAEATEAQKETIDRQLEGVRQQLADVESKKAEIVNLQNGKAGTVYIISNLGAFGDRMFKIGMTRRLVPEDRVRELGDASVPFPFDIYSMIFSQDAVGLEHSLHQRLNARRVNKVNLRKEFFDISVDELEALVSEIDPTAPFTRTMAAEQYRLSLSIDDPISNVEDMIEDDLEEEA